MYTQFFELSEDAYAPTIDPKFLFTSVEHRKVLIRLTSGILGGKRLITLVSEVGTGKTALISTIASCVPYTRGQFSFIADSKSFQADSVSAVLLGFGMREIPATKVLRLHQLQQFLSNTDDEGRVSTVIIDDAHKLSPESLEEAKLLGNFDSLQIVLVGHIQLDELLQREELRAVKHRVALRYRSIEGISRSKSSCYSYSCPESVAGASLLRSD